MDLDAVLDVMTDFPIQPYGYRLIITANSYLDGDSSGDFNMAAVRYNPTQYVVAVSDKLKGSIKPGSKVILDLDKMMVKSAAEENSDEQVGWLKLDTVEVNDQVYVMITESVIKAFDFREDA